MNYMHKFLFFNTMMIGTLIAISSISWFTIWIGLEINLLSMMPLMKQFKNKYSAEATIKYFIIQAMASALLLFSVVLFSNSMKFSIKLPYSTSLMVCSSLMLKMGAAPFHLWLPEVVSGMNWEMIYIILTWQKIAPMILVTYTIKTPIFLSIIVILSSTLSGLQGMNQTCLRKIMAYSSINHMSWMISSLLSSISIWACYFIVYCFINFNIIFILNKYKMLYLNQLSNLFSYNKKMKFLFMLNFLSLGGLPPFLGFFPKWMTINHMIKNNFYILTVTLIIFTLMSLYMYMRITFSSFSINSTESLTKIFKKISYFQFFINFLSLIGLIMCIITINLF